MLRVTLLAVLFMGAASAQTIVDYPSAPNIKTLRVGALECTLWRTGVSVQVACCNNTCAGIYSGTLALNQIQNISKGFVPGGYGQAAIGSITWVLSPGMIAGTINFQISVALPDGTGPPAEIGVWQ